MPPFETERDRDLFRSRRYARRYEELVWIEMHDPFNRGASHMARYVNANLLAALDVQAAEGLLGTEAERLVRERDRRDEEQPVREREVRGEAPR
jgi:hypothetical protein